MVYDSEKDGFQYLSLHDIFLYFLFRFFKETKKIALTAELKHFCDIFQRRNKSMQARMPRASKTSNVQEDFEAAKQIFDGDQSVTGVSIWE